MAIFISFLALRSGCLSILNVRAVLHAQLSIFSNLIVNLRRQMSSGLSRDIFGGGPMLWTLFVILLVLWLIGVVSSYTLGGFIHLLLVLALVALVFQLLTGRRTAV
jgi:hypothetical protein